MKDIGIGWALLQKSWYIPNVSLKTRLLDPTGLLDTQ